MDKSLPRLPDAANGASDGTIRPVRARFMTFSMWLAWLLRGDIRRDHDVGDIVAQQDFVAWWMLFGCTEYPNVWSYGPQQAAIAVADGPRVGGVSVPRLLHKMWLNRADLQNAFPMRSKEQAINLLCWYRLRAAAEHPGAIPLQGRALDLTEAPSTKSPWRVPCSVPRIAVALWETLPELQRVFPKTDPVARQNFVYWFERTGRSGITERTPQFSGRPQEVPKSQARKAGVNLVGFAHAEFGLGEDVRMMSLALRSAGIPHVIIDAGTPDGTRAGDGSCADYVADRFHFQVSVFCMTAFDTCQLYLERGPTFFNQTYNIGSWAWELPTFPSCWAAAMSLVSEIWAATRYTLRAFSATSTRPVHLLRPTVQPGARTLHKAMVRSSFTFIYPFDPKSFLSRKNPEAAVRAFRRAFRRGDRKVKLILRPNGEPRRFRDWSRVAVAMRGDPRVIVKAGTMERQKSLELVEHCDCLISPHRAEGFGRNIAEAIALGVPVIATAFSGSKDYLEPRERLSSSTRRVRGTDYPFGKGQVWCEPSVKDLAAMMRQRRFNNESAFAKKRRSKRFMQVYAPAAAGRRLRARLAAIWLDLEEGGQVTRPPGVMDVDD